MEVVRRLFHVEKDNTEDIDNRHLVKLQYLYDITKFLHSSGTATMVHLFVVQPAHINTQSRWPTIYTSGTTAEATNVKTRLKLLEIPILAALCP